MWKIARGTLQRGSGRKESMAGTRQAEKAMANKMLVEQLLKEGDETDEDVAHVLFFGGRLLKKRMLLLEDLWCTEWKSIYSATGSTGKIRHSLVGFANWLKSLLTRKIS